MNPEPRQRDDYSPRQVEAARRVLVDLGQELTQNWNSWDAGLSCCLLGQSQTDSRWCNLQTLNPPVVFGKNGESSVGINPVSTWVFCSAFWLYWSIEHDIYRSIPAEPLRLVGEGTVAKYLVQARDELKVAPVAPDRPRTFCEAGSASPPQPGVIQIVQACFFEFLLLLRHEFIQWTDGVSL